MNRRHENNESNRLSPTGTAHMEQQDRGEAPNMKNTLHIWAAPGSIVSLSLKKGREHENKSLPR